jgi:hypothetical protein
MDSSIFNNFPFTRISKSTVIDRVKEAVIMNIDLVGGVEFPAVDCKRMTYDNN